MPHRVGLVYDDRFLDHHTGSAHPERPDRLRAVVQHLHETSLWDRMSPIEFTPATDEALGRLHTPSYLARLKQACAQGKAFIDTPDSAIVPESEAIARLAAGGVIALARAVAGRALDHGLALVRPPGHHAEADRSMGFCLYANAALTAQTLLDDPGIERVAVLDFDVHHGNGTQHLFETRDDVMVVSMHEDPSVQYPGTGFAHEQGLGPGAGFTLNLPLPPGTDDQGFLRAWREQARPALDRVQPDALVISAGFDAAAEDPLGHLEVSSAGFAALTQEALAWARSGSVQGRVVALLEGGYDLEALSRGVEALTRALLEVESSDA